MLGTLGSLGTKDRVTGNVRGVDSFLTTCWVLSLTLEWFQVPGLSLAFRAVVVSGP